VSLVVLEDEVHGNSFEAVYAIYIKKWCKDKQHLYSTKLLLKNVRERFMMNLIFSSFS